MNREQALIVVERTKALMAHWEQLGASPIRLHLIQLAAFYGDPPEGWRYANVSQLVLEVGVDYTPAPLPEGIKRGRMRECYANALHLATERPDLTYVEGYATSIIPVDHAWCVDPDGNVVDPTWDEPETQQYLGVAIPRQAAWEHCQRTGYFGVLQNGWLLRSPILRFGLSAGLKHQTDDTED